MHRTIVWQTEIRQRYTVNLALTGYCRITRLQTGAYSAGAVVTFAFCGEIPARQSVDEEYPAAHAHVLANNETHYISAPGYLVSYLIQVPENTYLVHTSGTFIFANKWHDIPR